METNNPVVITLNGEAKAIIQSIHDYEQDRETLALLKILSMSRKSIEDGKYLPARQAFAAIRQQIAADDAK